MLNLLPIFRDAIVACEQYGQLLSIAPLPAAIFMMQRDVINHYRYALTHYLTVPLDSPFLQNSTLGSPYEKWATFTNQDFELLAVTIHELLRSTSRLVHETECRALREAGQYVEMKARSNDYTGPICEVRHQTMSVGVRVEEGHVLFLTAFGRPFQVTRYDINDRSVLAGIRDGAMRELDELASANRSLGEWCNRFYSQRQVAAEFDALNESWWM